jgi:hypothetical protein
MYAPQTTVDRRQSTGKGRRATGPAAIFPDPSPVDCRLSTAGSKGAALITSLICLMLIETLGAAIMSVSLTGLHLAEHVSRTTLAFNLAESGGERATRWLKDQPSPPSGTTAVDPFSGVQSLGDGAYSVALQPDPGNSGAVLKKYIITSSGTVMGRAQTVKLVLREDSFGKYAYFTDKEVSSVSGGVIWFISSDRIRGPAHSNNSDGGSFHINWANGTGPIFQGMVTSSASSVTYAPSNPVSASDYQSIYATGVRGFQLGVDPIPLPSSTTEQQVAAWGAASGFPTTNGVYVPNASGVANGGIYIAGDAAVQMQLDGSGNQQFVVTQGSTTTTLTVDRVNNQIRHQVGSGPVTTYSGVGSGVLYCSGNITSLSGTVADNQLDTGSPPNILSRSAYTIGVDTGNDKSITVTNPITYHSAPDPTLSITDPTNLLPGTLGLIGRNVVVGSGAPTNMEIDAEILAGRNSTTYASDTDGSFYVSNYNTKTPTGTLKIMGGVIQRARGPVGTFSGGTIATGYAKNYYYDTRMADNPPPYFPTTGGYDRISWQKLPG